MNTKNKNNMEKLAESLYEAHRNPIVKLGSFGNKLYLPQKSSEEKKLVLTTVETLKKALDFPRVDRRCGRSIAMWLEDQHLAKILKKHYQSFGFQDKTGIYLYPEEALFLLETNKLELQWKGVPVSVQQAYSLIINGDILTLNNYKIYKRLALEGYKITKLKTLTNNDDVDLEPKRKKIKHDVEDEGNVSIVNSRVVATKCSYEIFNPKTKDNFDVRVVGNGELEPKMCLSENGAKTLCGISLPNNENFYRFAKVEIPDISNDDDLV